MTEDNDGSPGFRETRDSVGNHIVKLSGVAGDALSQVRLTAAATALLESSHELRWVVMKAQELRLPEDEFEIVIGVKVERGYGRAVDVKYLPPAIVDAANQNMMSADIVNEEKTAIAKISVRVVAVELAFKWWGHSPKPTSTVPNTVTIPVAFPVAVLNPQQNQAVWRTKIRWLMTELVLARYGLDSYREIRT